MATATMTPRPPLPPFTRESAIQKVRLAEDAWNTRDPALAERPEFFDKPVVQLVGPLAGEECNDFVSSVDKLRSVPPS